VYPSGETEDLLNQLQNVASEQRRILDRQSELITQLQAELRRGVRDDGPDDKPAE
jgi:hypothetical protein